jgi:hypothetical protein
MIRVDLKRHGEPSPLYTVSLDEQSAHMSAEVPTARVARSIVVTLLRRALAEDVGTVVTLNITDEDTGRTIFLRGRVK